MEHKTTKTWEVKMQTGPDEFKTIKVKSANHIQAWRKAMDKVSGVVVSIQLSK